MVVSLVARRNRSAAGRSMVGIPHQRIPAIVRMSAFRGQSRNAGKAAQAVGCPREAQM
jgi:hypothetical protein